ncbi:AI-2E family transporter [Halodesulfovibrio sp.]|jgi:predicted PurR-regulated permease PerM|uniref:AI-2E family transporter n=1 Tax=Halodesulfovibrio sp. TaxID=1912772 RepID=UPI0025E02452|nr:AI-2E family transporter [Halodesulfovibrio sp.]MCT4534900.1 AI-2E family transporter [Halodesulfovibrio sp.]MCT4627787.1 AI-2E family transporter [Halodesulfovibrio sp.]
MHSPSRLQSTIITLACTLLILFAARSAQSIVIPLLLSIFIAIIITVPIDFLRRGGLSTFFSVGIVIIVTLFFEAGTALLLGKTISQFSRSLPEYQSQVSGMVSRTIEWLNSHGIDMSDSGISDTLNPDLVLSFANSFISGLGSALSNITLIMFTVLFMLIEARNLPLKIQAIDNNNGGELLDKYRYVIKSTKQYISIKALTSIATGILITVGLSIVGLNFASLWGFLAFALNFIPNIGSIIAAAPAVLLAGLQFGAVEVFAVISIYLIVNIVIGNMVEPAILGNRVGLSTLTVFLSLLFWGWLLGSAGMLLSIPLTMVIKYGAEAHPQTRWLAILLAPAPQPPSEEE